MAKAAFTHADGSIPDDHRAERRHFPRRRPHAVGRAVADWIPHHEPGRPEAGGDRRGGRTACLAVARVMRTGRDPQRDAHLHARMADRPPFSGPPPFRTGAPAPRPHPRFLDCHRHAVCEG